MTVRPARLAGELTLPASKSVAQRALIATALTGRRFEKDAPVFRIDYPGADVVSIAHAMAVLGSLEIEQATDEILIVRALGTPSDLGSPEEPLVLDCGNSGTGMRLLMGALAGLLADRPGAVTLTGDASLSARPMERVASPLRRMGARIETAAGHAPLTVIGPAPLAPIDIALPVPSAQILTALCLAALATDGTTTIDLPGPSRDHTERFLAHCGVDISRSGETITSTTITGPADLELRSLDVPGDESSAAFWLAAAALHPDAEITVTDVGLNPTRTAFLTALHDMGATIEIRPDAATGPEPTGTLIARSGATLRPIAIEGLRSADLIDELPILAVVMAGTPGTSTVRDAAELRVKESDRITLTCEMLRAAGIDVIEHDDGFTITGSDRRFLEASGEVARVRTDGDHRIAMAAAILEATGISPHPIVADDEACAAVSYPRFFDDLAALSGPRPAPAR